MGRLYQFQVARYSKSAIWLPYSICAGSELKHSVFEHSRRRILLHLAPDFKSGASALGCSDKADDLSDPLNSSLMLHPGNSLPGWMMATIASGRESCREKASEPRDCLL